MLMSLPLDHLGKPLTECLIRELPYAPPILWASGYLGRHRISLEKKKGRMLAPESHIYRYLGIPPPPALLTGKEATFSQPSCQRSYMGHNRFIGAGKSATSWELCPTVGPNIFHFKYCTYDMELIILHNGKVLLV